MSDETAAAAAKAATPTPAKKPRDLNPAPPKAKGEAAHGKEAPLYRVVEKSFIGHTMVEEGEEVHYVPEGEGSEIGENLIPVNAAAQAFVDAQKGPHPSKGKAKGNRSPRAAADAASAGVVDAAAEDEDDFA